MQVENQIQHRDHFIQQKSLPMALSKAIQDPLSTKDPGALLTIREVEKNHIEQTLKRFSGNHTKTAIALGISISTLKRKLRRYAQYAN